MSCAAGQSFMKQLMLPVYVVVDFLTAVARIFPLLTLRNREWVRERGNERSAFTVMKGIPAPGRRRSMAKIMGVAASLILILATLGVVPSGAERFGNEEDLKQLIASGSLPQLPSSLDFQKQLETRLKELEERVFAWPTTPAQLKREEASNQIHILSGKASIPQLYQEFGEEVIEQIGEEEYLLKSTIIIEGGYLTIEAITLRLDVNAIAPYQGHPAPIEIELRNGFLSIRQSIVSSWDQGEGQ